MTSLGRHPLYQKGGERRGVWQLLSALAASFVFCALFAIGGVLGAETVEAWIAWMVGCGCVLASLRDAPGALVA
jgi:hypothetical protein